MIWMKKLHMINWMYYGIQTMEIGRSNLLAGKTGSGKSSLIDALLVVLVGETGRFFNRSATGGKTERSVVRYLRGEFQENDCKRADKAFSSYLAVDFYDDVNHEEFCYGVVFDLSEDNIVDKDYFYIPKAFRQEWAVKSFGEQSAARSRSEFKKELKEQEVSFKLFTLGEYRGDLLARLGIYDEHFFQVFRTAVAYVPLNNIEEFIIKNICHMEGNIDVPKMKAAIHEYQRMQRDMMDFQERKNELEGLKAISLEFASKFEICLAQEYIVFRAKADRLQEEQQAAEKRLCFLSAEQERCKQEEERMIRLSDEKQQRQMELTEQINGDPATVQRKKLEGEITVSNQEIQNRKNAREKQLELLKQRLMAWERHLQGVEESPVHKKIGRDEIKGILQSFGHYSQYTVDNFDRLDVQALEETNERLGKMQNEAFALLSQWTNQRDESEQRAIDYHDELENLKKGVKSYPKDLLDMRGYLQDSLSEHYSRPVVVSILADLITITDPVWVNVVEGYLRRQKFFLLTEPEYYQEAVRFFKKHSGEKHCYQYRIVNTGSILTEHMDIRETSLAKVVETHCPAARKYIDFLLGRVERVEDIEAVNGRRTAVTAEGMLYQGFTTARMNAADWRMRYIGQDSIIQQMKEILYLLQIEEAQVKSLNQLINPFKPWTEEKTLSAEFLQNLECAVHGTQELPDLEKKLDSLWEEIQRIDNTFVKTLLAEQKEIKAELSDIWEKSKETSRKIGELSTQYKTCCKLCTEKGAAWKEEYARFTTQYPERNEVAEQTALRYEKELRQKGSAEKLLNDFAPALDRTKSRLDTLISDFRTAAEEFNRRHMDASVCTDLSSDEWRKAYDEVNTVKIEEFTEQVAAARERANEIFRNEFINQIKRNIDTVKREISLLNKALEEYTFGQTRYRFKCSPTENADMRKYYDMITNSRLDGTSIYDLLEPGMDFSEYEPQVKTLFQLISSEGTDLASRQQAEANIEKYKSFQTYLRFDLVEVAPDGKENSLSRTLGRKSGGERQTPFYVAVLASLMKAYRVNQETNSLRLVVFDEAFDKIDTSRIEECVNMLREIGFQSIIAAPDSKAPYIAPLVDRTWVVIKPDDQTTVLYPYQKMLEGDS